MEQILNGVRAVRSRLLFLEALQALAAGLAGTGFAVALLILARRLFGPFPALLWVLPVLGLAVFAAGRTWRRRPSMRTAALALDQAAGLQERVSAALYLKDDGSPAAQAILRDAEKALARAEPARLPWSRPPLRRYLMPVLAVAAVSLLPIPRPSAKTPPGPGIPPVVSLVPENVRKQESEKLQRRALSLEKKAQELDKPELKAIADAMKKAGEELHNKEISKTEALSKISSLEEKAREQKDALASKVPESLVKRMKESGSSTAGGDKKEELAKKLSELAKATEELKNQLAKGLPTPEDQAKLDKALKELADALGKEFGGELPKDLQKRLEGLEGKHDAKDLEALEKALAELDGTLDDLAMLNALDGELEALMAEKDEFSDEEGTCLLCGKAEHGLKKGVCRGCRGLAQGNGNGNGEGNGNGFGRGDGRGPDGTSNPDDPSSPTKLRGDLSPGQIIGSIQFKTLPEKGQLRSSYAEAFKATAAEHSEALQQEEIPPGYRLHVRDYFDSIRPDKEKK